jgi:imidazolonepropionase-like amidohydrolase
VRLILRAPRLWDGVHAEPLRDAALVIRDERIESVRQGLGPVEGEAGEEVRTVEVADGTILPGFVEGHTHMHCSPAASNIPNQVLADSEQRALLRATACVRTLVSVGVTTVRDIGSRNSVAFAVRDAIRDGIILGPRMLVSGAPITTTGGHFWYMGNEADSEDEVRQAFRRQVRAGADFIKIMVTGGGTTPGTNPRRAQYSLRHMQAAVEEKQRLQKGIVAHCHATEGIGNAAEAGVDTIVHCSWMAPEDGTDFDRRILERIIERGIFVDPTLAVYYRSVERRLAHADEDPGLEAVLAGRREKAQIMREMWEQGARFITGTDSGMPNTEFADWALSAQLFVEELGLSFADTLAAATRICAEALGLQDETGTLEPGKAADAVIVRGDPSARITALFEVDTVVLAGRLVKQGGGMLV